MCPAPVVSVIGFEVWKVGDCFVHIFDDQFIIVHNGSLLRRYGVVVIVGEVLVTYERHSLFIRTVPISDQIMCPTATEVSFAQAAFLDGGQRRSLFFLH